MSTDVMTSKDQGGKLSRLGKFMALEANDLKKA